MGNTDTSDFVAEKQFIQIIPGQCVSGQHILDDLGKNTVYDWSQARRFKYRVILWSKGFPSFMGARIPRIAEKVIQKTGRSTS